MLYSKVFKIFGPRARRRGRKSAFRTITFYALAPLQTITMSEEKIDIQAEIDAAMRKGQYADRKDAIAALQKQLVDYQKGALKDALKGVPAVPAMEEAVWKELLAKAGGDEDKAVQLYLDELKKLNL